jgi:hypothetical protein
MRQIAELIALVACGLFTGAAWYISFVEHPARMECGVEVAAVQFSPSYRRARVMQASLAVVCLLSSVAAWLAGATFWWAVAGVLLGSVIPFTLIVILPTNKQLLSPTLDKGSRQAAQLLARWGTLHDVRSVLSGMAFLLFLYLLIFTKAI